MSGSFCSSHKSQIVGSETRQPFPICDLWPNMSDLLPFWVVTKIKLNMIEICCETTKFSLLGLTFFTQIDSPRRKEIRICSILELKGSREVMWQLKPSERLTVKSPRPHMMTSVKRPSLFLHTVAKDQSHYSCLRRAWSSGGRWSRAVQTSDIQTDRETLLNWKLKGREKPKRCLKGRD